MAATSISPLVKSVNPNVYYPDFEVLTLGHFLVGKNNRRSFVDTRLDLPLDILEFLIVLVSGRGSLEEIDDVVSVLSTMLGPIVDQASQMGLGRRYGRRVVIIVPTSEQDSCDKVLSMAVRLLV